MSCSKRFALTAPSSTEEMQPVNLQAEKSGHKEQGATIYLLLVKVKFISHQ